MLGAIIGDIVGSRFEFNNRKSKEFRFFHNRCRPTDDSCMTLAVARAILNCGGDAARLPGEAVRSMQEMGRRFPYAGYGGTFREWLRAEDPQPYNSWGNGAAMRVSPCGWAANTLEEALAFSDAVTGITHDHPEGLKGARAVTAAIFLARQGADKGAILDHIRANYYPLGFTLDGIRPDYRFDVSCQGSVPQAIEAFAEGADFEDTVRGAVSIGGDSDTIAAIAGSIAEAHCGIPAAIREEALGFLPPELTEIVTAFEARYGAKRI